MEGPKTPPKKASARQGTPTPDNNEPKTPPGARRLIRTAPTSARAPPDDVDAPFSRERPGESPTLKQNRRLLEATHTDLRYLDRPIARPAGPRPAPAAPQRPKRHRRSEPVAGALAGEEGGQMLGEKAPLVGPRPLVKSPSLRRHQLDDPFGAPLASRRFGRSGWTRGIAGVEAGEESDSSTPKASKVNKRRTLGKTGMVRMSRVWLRGTGYRKPVEELGARSKVGDWEKRGAMVLNPFLGLVLAKGAQQKADVLSRPI